MSGTAEAATNRRLIRLLWLSIAAAILTIGLKTGAWALTGSVGLLSDAMESVVNLVAAAVALAALSWAQKPADDEHLYGHAKAEYFSAGVEGGLIFFASAGIAVTAIDRFLHPSELSDVGIGVLVSAAASVINLVVGLTLVRQGRLHHSLTLEADGRHLLTDVWTSVGVIAGVVLVSITGWNRLDPVIALAVAANITFTGISLIRRSVGGLMDRALGEREHAGIDAVLESFRRRGIEFHALRTRQAGRRAFISVHVLVPGGSTVQRGHDLAEDVEDALREVIPRLTILTHLEPIEDPRSFEDTTLDRLPPGPDTAPG
ncbi:MAG: cation diffusion facilitator family transporter [Thermoleophilia bacterium]